MADTEIGRAAMDDDVRKEFMLNLGNVTYSRRYMAQAKGDGSYSISRTDKYGENQGLVSNP
jgi:hypothetical protein